MIDISVIIPLLNEEGNLPLLYEKISQALQPLDRSYEIVYVDDGSTDNSLSILTSQYEADPVHVRIISFRRNFGKTAALVAGFKLAEGKAIVTLDADLQDDPSEIPAMLEELEKGYDIVSGWRVARQDRTTKKISSKVWNTLVRIATGTTFKDINCGFKVYRGEVARSLRLYSDMHRFVPILAVAQGFKVVEKPVSHHPRHSGRSRYGTLRASGGFFDLLAVLFLTSYARKPLRFFGWAGASIFGIAAVVLTYLAALWFLRAVDFVDTPPIGTRPLFFAGILGMILGFQMISIGLLGEMIRYYTYRPTEEYTISEIWKS